MKVIKVTKDNLDEVIDACCKTLLRSKQELINLLIKKGDYSTRFQVTFTFEPFEIPIMTITENKFVKNDNSELLVMICEVSEDEDN